MTLNSDDLPRGMRAKTLASGQRAWYWQPTPKDIKAGFTPKSVALGPVFSTACKVAEGLNADLDNWRGGVERLPYEPGTFDWLVAEYEKTKAYRNLKPKTARDYSGHLGAIAKIKLKSPPGPLGKLELERINTRTADKIHEKLETRGSRTAAYAIAVVRRAWSAVWRSWPEYVPETNPFMKMDIGHTSEETKPANWGQLDSFVSKAIAMGELGMAIAARAAWDLCMRPTEIYDQFLHTNWRPDSHPHQCWVGSAKNGNGAWVYVADPETGTPFYPELESLIGEMGMKATLIVARRRQKGVRVYDDWVQVTLFNGGRQAKKIREAAKLPAHVTIEAFRHGGLTELGEGDLSDSYAQALSRHKRRATLDRYLHKTDTLSLAAARKRAAHRKGK